MLPLETFTTRRWEMRLVTRLSLSAIVLTLLGTVPARGQFLNLSQSATLSSDGAAQDVVVPYPQQTNIVTDNVNVHGDFSGQVSNSITDIATAVGLQVGITTSAAGGDSIPFTGGVEIMGAMTTYSPSFMVATPMQFVLDESTNCSAGPAQGGVGGAVQFFLTSSDQSVSTSDVDGVQGMNFGPSAHATGPNVYQADLAPGVTYSIMATVSSTLSGDDTTEGNTTSTLNFTETLTQIPEPGSVALVFGMGCVLVVRRRRG